MLSGLTDLLLSQKVTPAQVFPLLGTFQMLGQPPQRCSVVWDAVSSSLYVRPLRKQCISPKCRTSGHVYHNQTPNRLGVQIFTKGLFTKALLYKR